MMKSYLSIGIGLKNELMTTVRLTVGGVASAAGLSYDDGEDCKLCVTESLLYLSHRGYEEARIAFYRENGLRVVIDGEGEGKEEGGEGDEISVALLNALANDVVIERSGGAVRSISFRFETQK